jgi:hypothetical protein
VPAEWVIGREDDFPYTYGYLWWRFKDQARTAGNLAVNDVYFAWGLGAVHFCGSASQYGCGINS